MTVVIDASAALSWVSVGQRTDASLMLAQQSSEFEAPGILAVEVRQAVLKLERRKLLTAQEADAGLALLSSRIRIEQIANDPEDLDRIVGLARRMALGFFDAIYLDLAMRHAASLASRDAALLAAAQQCSLQVIDIR